MRSLVVANAGLPAMTPASIAAVQLFQGAETQKPQVALDTQHVLHAGLYARTIRLPAGVTTAAALIKIPTLVIVEGDVLVWLGAESRRLTGYTVLPASAGRKQIFSALLDTVITMVFPTDAKTVEEAERAFTDEADLLASRRKDTYNEIIITGE